MKFLRTTIIMALLLIAGATLAADMGTSDGFDLDALWQNAQQTYNLAQEDAVVLLERREIALDAEGNLATTIHRVVWVNSTVGIHQYADLRVPWNSANSELKVEALRTWRDGRWWPDPAQVSKTAVVETLPYAVDHADDYTAMRETMLLHDGVQLPCIMETRYVITRHGAPAATGVFVFPQRDPALRVQLTVTTPTAVTWHEATLNGAPQPMVMTTEGGLRRAEWDMSPVDPLGLPVTDKPAAYEPAVAYSTWESWQAMGKAFMDHFNTAAYIDGALADTLAARSAHINDPLALTRAVLDLVQDSTRPIHYDSRFWGKPRAATRTWETGYGHDLDRIALAAGALRSLAVTPATADTSGAASLTAEPVFLGPGTMAVAPDVPRLADAGQLALDIALPRGLRLFWTPDGDLHGAAWALGRPVTMPASGEPVFVAEPDVPNLLAIDLKVAPTDDEGWTWSGTLITRGIFSFQGAVLTDQPLDKAALAALGKVLPDTELDTCNPREFSPLGVAVVCDGYLAEPDAGDNGDITLKVDDPGDGVGARLPHDIHLYQSTRGSATLINPMQQDIRVQMPLAGFQVRRLPASADLTNAAGHLATSGVVKDGRLYYRRSLMLTGQGTWPELRALLVEASDRAHRDIVLHPGGEK